MATTLADLQAQLEQAKAALFKLSIGGSTRVIQDQNGERVEYTSGSVAALRSLILTLQWEIAQLGGAAFPLGPMRTLA